MYWNRDTTGAGHGVGLRLYNTTLHRFEQLIGGEYGQLVDARVLQDGRLVIRREGDGPIVLDSSGVATVISDTVLYRGEYAVRADGMLMALRGNVVDFHRDVQDPAPYASYPAGPLDAHILPTYTLGIDSAGDAVVGYLSFADGSTSSGFNVVLYRITLTDQGPADTIARVIGTLMPVLNCNAWSSIQHVRTLRRKSCDNIRSCLVHFEIICWNYDNITRQPVRSGSSTRYYTYWMDQNGNTTVCTYIDDRCVDSIQKRCLPIAPPITLRRLPNLITSEIIITGRVGTHTLSLPTAIAVRNDSQITPSIRIEGDHLLVGWRTLGTTQQFVLTEPMATLREEAPIIDRRLAYSSSRILPPSPNYDYLIQTDNWFALQSFQRSLDTLVSREHITTFHRATDSGWRALPIADTLDFARSYVTLPPAHSPISSITLILHGTRGSKDTATITLTAVDSSGRILWQRRHAHNGRSLEYKAFPVGEDRYLQVVQGTLLAQIDSRGDTIATATLPSIGNASSYRILPLLDSSFLRVYWGYGSPPYVKLDRFDYRGNTLGSCSLPLTSDIPNGGDLSMTSSVVMNPSDSGFAVLYGGGIGVRCYLLDKNLNVLERYLPVSTDHGCALRPTGVFRNDTLFAVWEDYRDTVPDIYGCATLLRTRAAVWDARAIRRRTLTVTPNPATHQILLRSTDRRESGGEITIIDMRGETILRVPQEEGGGETVITVSSLASGLYKAVVQDVNSAEESNWFVVYR